MAFDLEIQTQELQNNVDLVTYHLRKWEPIRYFSTIGKYILNLKLILLRTL